MTLPHGVKRRFTDDEVREIRKEYKEDRSKSKYWSEQRKNIGYFAEKYGVTKGAISHLLTRRTYKHVL